MADFEVIAQELLGVAEHLADVADAKRIIVFYDCLPENPKLSERIIIVARDEVQHERALRIAEDSGADVLDAPDVNLERTGQVNLAAVLSLSSKMIENGERAIILVGPRGKPQDTLHIVTVGDQLNIFDTADEEPGGEEPLPKPGLKHVHRAVFQQVLSISLDLANEGREGRSIGAFFVLGDTDRVFDHVEQLVMNPFRGYPSEARNILSDELVETVKEFSAIDGAFVVRGDGTVESAGTLVRASLVEADLPKGLGARHAAAAGITRVTNSIALTVSQSDGTVRVWRRGKIVTVFERANS
ncbi:MAG: DNA integrity scanning protein DisA nucleotide-binding domain protein [Planctomycetota bacterium]